MRLKPAPVELHVYFYISDCDLLRFSFFFALDHEHYLFMCKYTTAGVRRNSGEEMIPRLSMARRVNAFMDSFPNRRRRRNEIVGKAAEIAESESGELELSLLLIF